MKTTQTAVLIYKEKEVKKSINKLMLSKEIRNKMVEKLENSMIRIVA